MSYNAEAIQLHTDSKKDDLDSDLSNLFYKGMTCPVP